MKAKIKPPRVKVRFNTGTRKFKSIKDYNRKRLKNC